MSALFEAAAPVADNPKPSQPDDPTSAQPPTEGARPPGLDPDKLLEGLNPQQRQAVVHAGSPLLIVAGAGSGKTRVLTHRIAYLLAAREVHPAQIMAITFTNKAAAEMRQRVVGLIGRRANAMWVSTFHSMCVRLLRREAAHLQYGSSFSIYDQDDSTRLINAVARDLDLDPKRYPARQLGAQISNLKNELLTAADAAAGAGNDFERRIAEVYDGYQRRLVRANAMDFDDLIMRTVELLQSVPEVAQRYRRRFRHVLVDEYQDTNHAQYVLVRELAGPGSADFGDLDSGIEDDLEPGELCVVGDADQSIYAFRGATIRNIVEFEHDFPNARTIMIEQNYRSTQNILSAANALISRNPDRRDKRLWSDAGDGERIVGYVADNDHDEAAFVAGEIDRLVDGADATFGDVAVFYRTNSASRVFEEVFIRLGLPYRVVGGVRFYERREVRDALAYLRVLDNPDDVVSLLRILNTPRRGIGDRAQASVAAHAETKQIGFAAALREAAAGRVPLLPTRSQHAIAEFVALWDELRDLAGHGGGPPGGHGGGPPGGHGGGPPSGHGGGPPSEHRGEPPSRHGAEPAEVLEAVLERTGYRAELERTAEDDPQDASRLDNLNELVTVAREFTEQAATVEVLVPPEGEVDPGPPPGSLSAFLERVSLVADADTVPDSADGMVTLMTLHTAKGLEFPVVFFTGWEDGVFPHQRAFGDQAELAEERRLAYVGITRARQRLYVSRAMVRSSWGQPAYHPASRFLAEVPESLVDWRRVEPDRSAPVGRTVFGRRGSDIAGSDSAQARLAARGMRSTPFRGWQETPALSLEVGDRVNHDKYGLGTVVATDGAGGRATATIDFGSSGTIRLMLIGGVPLVKL